MPPDALAASEATPEGLSSPTEERIFSEEQELLKRMRDERVDVGLSLIPSTPERKRLVLGSSVNSGSVASDAHAVLVSAELLQPTPASSQQPQKSESKTLSDAELRSRLAFLKRVTLFRGWDDALLEEVAGAMIHRVYGPHQTVVRQDGHSETVCACFSPELPARVRVLVPTGSRCMQRAFNSSCSQIVQCLRRSILFAADRARSSSGLKHAPSPSPWRRARKVHSGLQLRLKR